MMFLAATVGISVIISLLLSKKWASAYVDAQVYGTPAPFPLYASVLFVVMVNMLSFAFIFSPEKIGEMTHMSLVILGVMSINTLIDAPHRIKQDQQLHLALRRPYV
jgi:hypothetical protein